MWDMDAAPTVAGKLLGDAGRRWEHVQTVGRLADGLAQSADLAPEVVAAAWLHDIGYAPTVAVTGFHPLDGAAYLLRCGAPTAVVGLVAHHTGAIFEAAERGLLNEQSRFPAPKSSWLDALTLIDLVVAPDGSIIDPISRIDEILDRYAEDDPVHRAVVRSRDSLLMSAERARTELGLSDVWPISVRQRVGQP